MSDLVVVEPNGRYTLNFLDYELNRPGAGSGYVENVVGLLSTVLDAVEGASGSSDGREEGSYWKRGNRQILRAAVSTLALAKGRVSCPDLQRLVLSAPTSPEQLRSPEWVGSSDCMRWAREADQRAKTPAQQADFEQDMAFLIGEFSRMAERTRSVHISGVTTMLSVLNRSPLRELFCGETTITPEDAMAGKVIVLNWPVLEFHEIGLYAQQIFKYVFQQSLQRRDPAQSPRVVLCHMDEAHYFLNRHDPLFLTTSREARVATVMLAQNVNAFYSALGGNEKARADAGLLFGNMGTKLFCANSDTATNEYAANVIGRSRQYMASGNNSYSDQEVTASLFGASPFGQRGNTTAGFSEVFELECQPQVFTRLRTGGPPRWEVDAILFQNGRTLRTGRTWAPVVIRQKH
ncbi:MAG: type IV secretory system conjugative DNA transfer family protein [Phycisphaerales bacterium]|nr:type IV secretory system conjugative DNA transfer family protein [Phycisphaerales bacterium]